MCGFDRLCFQGIAQSTRHSFRIAEIAHESTSSSANEKDRACIADPFANGAGAEEIDTLIIPDGGQADPATDAREDVGRALRWAKRSLPQWDRLYEDHSQDLWLVVEANAQSR